MRDRWTAGQVAEALGGTLVAGDPLAEGPSEAVVDSRKATGGSLFFGVAGEKVDGGAFAQAALSQGAWGVVTTAVHSQGLEVPEGGVVIAVDDPVAALAQMAARWRDEIGCAVIAVTGSTGKTSTKDTIAGMLAGARRTVATHENFNTEIGLPLTILGAPAETEVLVLEMAMRGEGQIAELARIARPDVGVVVNVGPVHLELLGSVEAVARAKAELIGGLAEDSVAVVPGDEPLLEPYLRSDLRIVRFGPGGEITELPEGLELPFASAHMRSNALAALAAVRALGVEPHGRIEVELSQMRGQRLLLKENVVVINDCYNANPMSMNAALDDLAQSASGRSVAVLGDMRELGADQRRFHAELGAHVREMGIDVLVTVGDLAGLAGPPFGGEDLHLLPDAAAAAELIGSLIEPGDTVLIKGSRGVGLEVVADALCEALPPAAGGDF
uniref:UDP-MurNAc-pentapeptide synthetase n=1 Tax=freshwater metagenome TaxID=449393 RepID=A0A6J5ZBB2_9ZZZZ